MGRRGSRLTSALLFVCAVLLGRTASADDGDDVLVRGNRGNFSSQITVADAPREVTDAASLVEPLPGVHVRRLGADDSFATLSIRGSSSTQVAVNLAGVPLSGGADPTLDLATLPLWPGARATVHRTFAPAALGRGSLGGTLVLDPPSARGPNATEVWAAAGSFGSLRLRAGDVRELSGVRVATGVSASRSDDDFSYLDAPATRAAGHDVFRTRQNAGHAQASGMMSLALPVDHGALTITTLAQARRQELPGSVEYPTPEQRLASSRLLEAIELTQPAPAGAVSVRAWARRETLALHDDPIEARVLLQSASSTDDVIVAAGGSAGWRGRPAEDALVELRLDGSGERFAPGTWQGGIAPPGATRANAGIALDTQLTLAPVILTASGRADAWVDATEGASTTEERPTGHAGVEVPVGPVTLASHAGWVTRPASFVERYGNRGAFVGAPGLKPESAFTIDAGAQAARRFGPVRVRAELAGFATWAQGLITYVYVGAQHFARATNIGGARILGVESEVRAWLAGFDLRAAYTGLATANEDECTQLPTGCQRPALVGRPAHDLVADLAWEGGPVRLRYGIDYVSGITIDDKGDIAVPARALSSASVRVATPVRGLSLTLDVRNLFDLRAADYIAFGGTTARKPIGDLYDYPLPGRRFLLSARWVSE